MNELELHMLEQHKKDVAEYSNDKGWFPDTILGDEIWPLYYCVKHYIGDDLWWEFV